jgi:hypothetical protein
MIKIVRLKKVDDVAILHVKIDKLNEPLVGFSFIRSIDLKNLLYNCIYILYIR